MSILTIQRITTRNYTHFLPKQVWYFTLMFSWSVNQDQTTFVNLWGRITRHRISGSRVARPSPILRSTLHPVRLWEGLWVAARLRNTAVWIDIEVCLRRLHDFLISKHKRFEVRGWHKYISAMLRFVTPTIGIFLWVQDESTWDIRAIRTFQVLETGVVCRVLLHYAEMRFRMSFNS